MNALRHARASTTALYIIVAARPKAEPYLVLADTQYCSTSAPNEEDLK